MNKDFQKFAASNCDISSITLDGYEKVMSNYISPVIPEERKMNVTTMDVFSRLLMDRIVFLGVPINDDVANIIQAQLLYLDSVKNDTISLYVNTPGGQVSSGLCIYDTMQYIKSDVSTICTGMAASMGSIILCGGQEGKRYALPHSKVLIHQPLGGANGQASDILIAAKEIEKTREILIDIIAKHSKQDKDKVFADADRDYWMTADEALEYGMIDKILTK